LTWPEVRDAISRDAGIAIPIGATEQHGLHLPLGTDFIIAERLAEAVADPLDLLVTPPVAYGNRSRPLSGGGQGFPGTMSLSARTFMAVLEDVVAESLRPGFRRVVLLNWHFENVNLVYEAASLAYERSMNADARVVVFENPEGTPSDAVMEAMFPDGFPGWDVEHAAILETSLMLHLSPDLVLVERAVDDQAPRRVAYDVIPPPDDFISSSGTLWKATQATAESGRLFWDEMVNHIVTSVQAECPQRTTKGALP
jgi:creatinine amidohydrolase